MFNQMLSIAFLGALFAIVEPSGPPSSVAYGQCGIVSGQIHCVGITAKNFANFQDFLQSNANHYNEYSLMNLVIWDSDVHEFPYYAFQGYFIGSLSFQYCFINYFPRYHLQYARNTVHTLIINRSTITSIYQSDFSGLPFVSNLINLDLSSNRIGYFDTNPFYYVRNLETLNLDNNQIVSLTSLPFRYLNSLKVLSVSSNYLSSINSNPFGDLYALNTLHLKNNQINSIALSQFIYNSRLRYFYLNDNLLSGDFSNNVFKGLENLFVFDLAGNPFNCKCTLDWFRQWLKTNTLIDGSNAVCSSPVSGQYFSQATTFCLGSVRNPNIAGNSTEIPDEVDETTETPLQIEDKNF